VRKSTKVEEITFRGAAEVRTDPFIFRGPVNEAGYEWLPGIDKKPRLVPVRVPGGRTFLCEPHPGLFREFAGLKPTREGIQSFAGKYGDLFNRYEPEQLVAREDGSVTKGSSLGTWQKEIGDMRVLVSLWDQIKTQQLAELQKIIRRTDKEISYKITTPRREAWQLLAHAELGGGLSVFDPDDVLLPARCALQMELNKRIAEAPTVPRLAWTPDYHQRLIFEPSNLLAAMWIQFAQDMTGKFRLVKCVCGDYFQVGPGAKKGNAITCGPRCRQQKKRNATTSE
jgi:hypothetical protein